MNANKTSRRLSSLSVSRCHRPIRKNWLVASLLTLFLMTSSPAQTGDFDLDGDWDCRDINELSAQLLSGANDINFDLTGDGLVNKDDGLEWLAVAGAQNLDTGQPYLQGDANLDGRIDVSDFMIWNGSKFTANSNWCDSDVDFSGVVDVSDFNIWNQNKFQSSGNPINLTFDPSPIDDAVDFTYNADSGLMTIDSNGLDVWCMSVYGAEPLEFLLNGATGNLNPNDSVWVQDFFLGHSKWFSTDITPVAEDVAIAVFETGLTRSDFDYVTFGTPDGTMGRGNVTIVSERGAVQMVPEPVAFWYLFPAVIFLIRIRRTR